MPTFEYRGYDHAGQVSRGLIEALDPKEAREKLAQQGVLTEKIEAAGARKWSWRRRAQTFDLDARAMFYRELASMLQAGLPLSQSLSLLMQAPEMSDNSAMVAGIRDRITEGRSLAESLGEGSGRVTAFEQSVVATGERSGRLDDVIHRLADFLEEQRQLRDRLISALLYPAVILGLSLVVGAGLLFFMLPAFETLLLDSGMPLPPLTRWVMAGSQLAAWLLPIAVLALMLAVGYIRRRWHQDPSYRVQVDQRLHRLPVFKSFYAVLVNLRFTRTLSMLLQSGLPLLDALQQAGRASGSPWLEALILKEAEQVRHGTTLSEAIARIPPLSGTLPGWIRAGEASGDLTGMLEHAAKRSQQTWERRITRSMTLVESGLVIVVGAIVFVLALAIVLPILSLNRL